MPHKEVSQVPLLWGIQKKKGHTGYTLLPADLVAKTDMLCQSQRFRCPKRGVGFGQTHCNPMRQLYRLPTRKPWRLLKPSRVTWRDSTTNTEEGHESAARAEVDLGLGQEADIETGLENCSRNHSRTHSRGQSRG